MQPEDARDKAGVAVIIVNWNSGTLLTQCLEALHQQTYKPQAIYVVDNASDDGSCDDLSSKFSDVTLIKLQENTGFARANNIAAKRVENCEWIALLNPDAFPKPQWLENLIAASIGHPEYAFFGSRMIMADHPEFLDGVGDVYHVSGLVWREGHGSEAAHAFLEKKEIFSPCAAAAMYKSDVFLEADGFDEDYFCYVEDMDLGFRLRLLGYRCLYVPDAVVFHKGSALTGKRSNFSVYHGHRNLVWTFVKNFPGLWLWLYLPQHILLNLFTPLWFLRTGGAKPAWQAKVDAVRGLPLAWKKRHKIQRDIRVKFSDLRPLMASGIGNIFFHHTSRRKP